MSVCGLHRLPDDSRGTITPSLCKQLAQTDAKWQCSERPALLFLLVVTEKSFLIKKQKHNTSSHRSAQLLLLLLLCPDENQTALGPHATSAPLQHIFGAVIAPGTPDVLLLLLGEREGEWERQRRREGERSDAAAVEEPRMKEARRGGEETRTEAERRWCFYWVFVGRRHTGVKRAEGKLMKRREQMMMVMMVVMMMMMMKLSVHAPPEHRLPTR